MLLFGDHSKHAHTLIIISHIISYHTGPGMRKWSASSMQVCLFLISLIQAFHWTACLVHIASFFLANNHPLRQEEYLFVLFLHASYAVFTWYCKRPTFHFWSDHVQVLCCLKDRNHAGHQANYCLFWGKMYQICLVKIQWILNLKILFINGHLCIISLWILKIRDPGLSDR